LGRPAVREPLAGLTYFGPWPTGAYQLSFDAAVSATGGSRYVIIVRDSHLGITGAGILLHESGAIAVNTPGTGSYVGTGANWVPGVYHRYVITIDPDEGLIRYFVDGNLIGTRDLPQNFTGFGQIQIQRQFDGADHLDLDDIDYRALYLGLQWVGVAPYAGVSTTAQASTVAVVFDGTTMEPGGYSGELVIRTNDPAEPLITVPLGLTVMPVSLDDDGGVTVTSLAPNHPNPFSGVTRIRYVIGEPTHVTLEVFSVTGQRVRLLTDSFHTAGSYEHLLDARSLASGVYLYRLTAGHTVDVRRMLIVR
jgi:hypothetical protein